METGNETSQEAIATRQAKEDGNDHGGVTVILEKKNLQIK